MFASPSGSSRYYCRQANTCRYYLSHDTMKLIRNCGKKGYSQKDVPTSDSRIILSISCPDRPGIVAAVSQFIFAHNGNIIESEQHSTDPHHGTFFLRVCIAA